MSPSARRKSVRFRLRIDDPLDLLVYDALRAMCPGSAEKLGSTARTLAILGLLAACGDDPRPLAKRLRLKKIPSIEGIQALLKVLPDSPGDASLKSAAVPTPWSEEAVPTTPMPATEPVAQKPSAAPTTTVNQRPASARDLLKLAHIGGGS
jgi:hypothetical protein